MKISLYIVVVIILGCTQVHNKKINYEEVISKLNNSLKNGDQENFDKLILNRLPDMPEGHNYKLLHRLYPNSRLYEINEIPYKVVDTSNHMGQHVIRIPYYKGLDSITAIDSINLLLYYGPEDLFPVDKLSNFETEIFYNKEYRKKLMYERLNLDEN